MDAAIRIENLSKQFGNPLNPLGKTVQALQDVNLEVKAGEVYGFLGPNGAGKTTTIRIMLDLVRPNSGDVFIFGQHVRRQHHILKRVSAQVEGANFYPFLNGRQNLRVMALTANLDIKPQRIESLLGQVGLADRAHRRFKGYSTGMKQRLGVAAALLSDPDLIILDEPTNGLDPQGIIEMRGFIRALADQHGKTVFLSSHLLGEIEQVCDRVAIINHGQIIQEGRIQDLISPAKLLRLEAEPIAKAQSILSQNWRVQAMPNNPNNNNDENPTLLIHALREDAPAIVRKLTEAEIAVYAIGVQRQSLEDFFLSATQKPSELNITEINADVAQTLSG